MNPHPLVVSRLFDARDLDKPTPPPASARYDEPHEYEAAKLDRIFPTMLGDGIVKSGAAAKSVATRYRRRITRAMPVPGR
jgi:hypothetical protein